MTPSGSGTRLTWDLRQPAYRRHSPPRHVGPRRAVSKYNRQGRQGYGQGKDRQPFRMLLFSEETNKTAIRLPVKSQFVHFMKHSKLVGVLTVLYHRLSYPLCSILRNIMVCIHTVKLLSMNINTFRINLIFFFHQTRSENFHFCVPQPVKRTV